MLGGAPCSFHGEKFSAAVALLVDVGGLEMTLETLSCPWLISEKESGSQVPGRL